MWYIAGTDTPIVITEDRIQLNDEVSYRYALNTDSKTLAFTFGRLQGEGRYRFSLDRQQLAIVDGAFGWWDTLGDDAGWTLGALVAAAQGKVANPADGSVEESGTVSANDGESAGGEGGAGSSDASASDAVSNGNLSEGVTLLSRTPASAKSASDVSRETSGGENAEESEGAAIGGAADASGAAGASSAADASTAADASAGDVAAADAAAALNSNSASAS